MMIVGNDRTDEAGVRVRVYTRRLEFCTPTGPNRARCGCDPCDSVIDRGRILRLRRASASSMSPSLFWSKADILFKRSFMAQGGSRYRMH
jgi:hypothetical protein